LDYVCENEIITDTVQSLIEWEKFRHTFSHYHLDIFPVVVQGVNKHQIKREGEWVCCQLLCQDKAILGIPAPVKKLVRLMSESEYV